MPEAKFNPAKLQVLPENAAKFKDWLANRGGLLVWQSQDLGDLGQSWTTPAKTVEGGPYPPPHWKCGNGPAGRHITDAADVQVVIEVEVARFHVGVKRGSGLMIVVNDAGTKKIRKAVEKAGEGAYHVFDYGSHDNCIILKPDKVIPLAEWQAPAEVVPTEG